jgi:hypothetical protein
VVSVKHPVIIALRFALATALTVSLSSFSMYPDTSTHPHITQPRNDDLMAITVVFHDEWEPGLPRVIRQISIDGDGHGQASSQTDDVVTRLATFDYRPDEFSAWHALTVLGLSDAYLSSEAEQQGLVVEGNPASYKFMFSWSGQIKIVDADPANANTPAALISLARQLQSRANTAHSQPLHSLYLTATPMGSQQSAEIMRLFATLPDVDKVRQLLNESERIVLDAPAWLVVLHDDTRRKIMDAFGMDAGSDFLHVKSQAGSVIKMEFVAAKPAGG